jgi:hypothetical protein
MSEVAAGNAQVTHTVLQHVLCLPCPRCACVDNSRC